jgi:hypothetical protein
MVWKLRRAAARLAACSRCVACAAGCRRVARTAGRRRVACSAAPRAIALAGGSRAPDFRTIVSAGAASVDRAALSSSRCCWLARVTTVIDSVPGAARALTGFTPVSRTAHRVGRSVARRRRWREIQDLRAGAANGGHERDASFGVQRRHDVSSRR